MVKQNHISRSFQSEVGAKEMWLLRQTIERTQNEQHRQCFPP